MSNLRPPGVHASLPPLPIDGMASSSLQQGEGAEQAKVEQECKLVYTGTQDFNGKTAGTQEVHWQDCKQYAGDPGLAHFREACICCRVLVKYRGKGCLTGWVLKRLQDDMERRNSREHLRLKSNAVLEKL